MRVIAMCVLAACHVASQSPPGTTMPPTSPPPATASSSGYGAELLGEDLAFIAGGDALFYTVDRVHARESTTDAALATWAFAWAASDAAIHYTHGNPLGAVLGPTLKLALPYVVGKRIARHHLVLASVLWIACMAIDDAVLAF